MPGPDLAPLLQAFRRLAPVGAEAFAALAPRVVPRSFARGGWLLRGGDRAEWCHLVVEGLVRELYVEEGGAEHTRRFLAEGQVTGSLLDLRSGRPSITWIQALEPTRTLAWRYAELEALFARHRELESVARRAAEELCDWKVRREHELLALPAARRHARWLAEQAALDPRVSRRHLASYLGVTPEHLSRLRRAARGPDRRRTAPR